MIRIVGFSRFNFFDYYDSSDQDQQSTVGRKVFLSVFQKVLLLNLAFFLPNLRTGVLFCIFFRRFSQIGAFVKVFFISFENL